MKKRLEEQNRPDIVFRTYTWKGEDWVAIYIDNKIVRLPLDRHRARWMSDKLDAPIHFGTEARNPAYFAQWGLSSAPPLQRPMPGVIRHPHIRDDGTRMVGPSRRLGPDAFSDSNDSPNPDAP